MSDEDRRRRLRRVDGMLRDMFRALQARPTPSRLASALEQDEEADPLAEGSERQTKRGRSN